MFKDLLDFLYRDGDSSNTVVGIILLFMLLVFVGPDILPTVLSRTLPFLTEGVPCSRLRIPDNRATHQSLIGRNSVNPFEMRMVVPPMPADPESMWNIQIIIENKTIGTVPFVYENQPRIGIGGIPDSSGLGIVFSPNVTYNAVQPSSNAGTTTFPINNIRVLGPRQQCAVRVQIPRNQISVQGLGTVSSYYRINTAGQIVGAGILPDQGLARVSGGIVQSQAETITFSATAN